MLMTILPFAIFSIIASPNQGGPRILKMTWLVKNFKPIRESLPYSLKMDISEQKSITFFNLQDVYRHVKAIGECIILYPNCPCFFNHASFLQC